MTNDQKVTISTLNEVQLQFPVDNEEVVINEIEAGVRWRIYIVHPNGTYKLVHFKGRPDKVDQIAISEANRIAARRNQMAKMTKEDIEEMTNNLPENVDCKYCDTTVKRASYGNHTRTKKHLENVKTYRAAHPEEFEKDTEGKTIPIPKTPDKPTSKTEKSTKETKTTKTAKGDKPARGAIGKYCLELLHNSKLADKTYEELAAMVREKFNSKTSKACIAWYVSQNKSDKTIVARSKPEKTTKPKKEKETEIKS